MTTLLVISDLHISDGDRVLDPWKYQQQEAFQTLLRLADKGGPLDDNFVELIFNGDTFDFLAAQPDLQLSDTTNIAHAHVKWSNIVSAHRDWFASLQEFLRSPHHRVTFLIGNHDMELWYPSIRARIRAALHCAPGMARFCLTQAYQPHPQLVIEHGCQFDPVNFVQDIWNHLPRTSTSTQLDSSDGRSIPVGPLRLSWGSRYYYHILRVLKQTIPCIDSMMPDLSPVRYVALACLLYPNLAIEAGTRLIDLLGPSAPSYNPPDASDIHNPVLLFHSLRDLFYQTIPFLIDDPDSSSDSMLLEEMMSEIAAMNDALKRDREQAFQHIISRPPALSLPDRAFISQWTETPPCTHFGIIGHTHHEGRFPLAPQRTLINTGTWTPRYVRPTLDAVDPSLQQWIEDLQQNTYPGVDGTRFPVAWVRYSKTDGLAVELIEIINGAYRQIDDMAMVRFS